MIARLSRLMPVLPATLGAVLLAACGSMSSVPTPQAPVAQAPITQGPTSPPASASVSVKVLAINDFHGNLLPSPGGIRIKDPAQSDQVITIQAGGAERLATIVQQLKAKNPNHVFVAAGDLVGASPLLSALFHDEPTIESLGMMGLDLSAVGNHEFDQGLAELLRKQQGGCHPKDGCKGPTPFTGAKYQYLAASTVDTATGKTVLPAYSIKRFEGVPVGFIGLTLKGTPELVSPSGVKGLAFQDEAETVNRLVPELTKQGVQTVVVLIHEGGVPTGGYNECPGISGPIVDIVKKLDPHVGLVVSGHTHRAYNCRIDGRLVTSGDKYGTLVSEIDLTLDRASGRLTEARADNLIVRPETPKDPRQTALIESYQKLAGPLIERPVGFLGRTLSKEGQDKDRGGGSTVGQAVADSMLAATQAPDAGGAQIALANIGGVRTGIVRRPDGVVTFGDLFAALPFSNMLVVMEYTGAQFQQALEEQWQGKDDRFMPLQVSQGLRYEWDQRRPQGQRLVPGSLTLNGQPIRPDQRLRVVVNSFLQAGGDGFPTLAKGRQVLIGPSDVQALEAYFKSYGSTPVMPTALNRTVRVDQGGQED